MSQKTVIKPAKAAPAIGPYNHAVRASDLLFCAGQIPLDPATGTMVQGSVSEQTERVLRNVAAILEAAGASMAQVVKTTVYLSNLDDFEEMNRVYARHFPADDPPARAMVWVSRLPKGASLEIDAIALS